MPVLKQTSPTGAGDPVWAPNPRPQNTAPSASTSAAVAPSGGPSPRSDSPVAEKSANPTRPPAIIPGQCREGIAPACRHLRTASVPTPASRAVASWPPNRSMISSTLSGIAGTPWEVSSRQYRAGDVYGNRITSRRGAGLVRRLPVRRGPLPRAWPARQGRAVPLSDVPEGDGRPILRLRHGGAGGGAMDPRRARLLAQLGDRAPGLLRRLRHAARLGVGRDRRLGPVAGGLRQRGRPDPHRPSRRGIAAALGDATRARTLAGAPHPPGARDRPVAPAPRPRHSLGTKTIPMDLRTQFTEALKSSMRASDAPR